LGVHLTAVCETGPGKSTLDAGSARAVAAAGPATAAGALATAAGALATSSPPLANNAVTLATAAVTQRGYVMGPLVGAPSHDARPASRGYLLRKKF